MLQLYLFNRAFTYKHFPSRYFSNRVAIVGSGPSGFYSAKYLLEQDKDIHVDMYDKIPTPFGLVRFGVAPDHPEVKSVTSTFCDVANSKRFRYFGNVTIGDTNGNGSIAIMDMLELYSGVILAHGATSDNRLGIPGSNLKGVQSARHFVNWYNGHPDFVNADDDATFDLSAVKSVVVIGQGNVALDCARVLTKSVDELAVTDITSNAVHALRRSGVKSVTVLGRRGHVQSAFTIKEFRELTRLSGVQLKVSSADMTAGLSDASKTELENNRPKKRIVELIQSVATKENGPLEAAEKQIDVRFLLTPVELLGDEYGRVRGLKVMRNRLEGEPNNQRAVPVTADEGSETIPCQLVLQSIGYKCEPLSPRLPFDRCTNTMPHKHGRVTSTVDGTNIDSSNSEVSVVNGVVRGLYVAGWLKRGPTGIVGSNINDAKETVASLLADLKSGALASPDSDPVERLLANGGFVGAHHRVVDWEGHRCIDAEELRRGQAATPPKEREKILDRQEMLDIAAGAATAKD